MTEEIDVFNMNPKPPPSAAPVVDAASKSPARPVKAGGSKWLRRISTTHIMVVGALAAAVVIFWPGASSPRPHVAMARFTPATAMAAAAQAAAKGAVQDPVEQDASESVASAQTAATPETAKKIADVDEAPTAASAPAPPPGRMLAAIPAASASASAPAESTSPETGTRTQRDDGSRLAIIEANVQRLGVQLSRIEKIETSKKRGHNRPKTETDALADAIVLDHEGRRYRVNTVGRDVAWLQAGSHVELVQPGDRIGLVRVLAVDPLRRLVVTSAGVIR